MQHNRHLNLLNVHKIILIRLNSGVIAANPIHSNPIKFEYNTKLLYYKQSCYYHSPNIYIIFIRAGAEGCFVDTQHSLPTQLKQPLYQRKSLKHYTTCAHIPLTPIHLIYFYSARPYQPIQ